MSTQNKIREIKKNLDAYVPNLEQSYRYDQNCDVYDSVWTFIDDYTTDELIEILEALDARLGDDDIIVVADEILFKAVSKMLDIREMDEHDIDPIIDSDW